MSRYGIRRGSQRWGFIRLTNSWARRAGWRGNIASPWANRCRASAPSWRCTTLPGCWISNRPLPGQAVTMPWAAVRAPADASRSRAAPSSTRTRAASASASSRPSRSGTAWCWCCWTTITSLSKSTKRRATRCWRRWTRPAATAASAARCRWPASKSLPGGYGPANTVARTMGLAPVRPAAEPAAQSFRLAFPRHHLAGEGRRVFAIFAGGADGGFGGRLIAFDRKLQHLGGFLMKQGMQFFDLGIMGGRTLRRWTAVQPFAELALIVQLYRRRRPGTLAGIDGVDQAVFPHAVRGDTSGEGLFATHNTPR